MPKETSLSRVRALPEDIFPTYSAFVESKTSADVWDRKVTLYNAERSRQRFYMIPLNDDLRTTVEGKTTKSTAPEKRIDRTKVRANLDYLLRTPVATQLALKMGSDDPGSEAPFFDPTKALAGRPEPASLAVGSTWQSKHYGVPSFVERAPQLLKMVEEDGSIALGDLRRYHCETYDQDKNSTAEEQYALLKRYKEYNALLMDMFNARAHESTGPWGAAEKPTTEAQGKWDDVSQTLPEDLRRQEKAPAEEVEYLECTFATFFEWVKKEEKKVGGTLAFKEKLQGIREKREEVYLKLHGMAEEIKKRPASSDKIPEGCNRPETYLSGYTTPLFKGDYETSER